MDHDLRHENSRERFNRFHRNKRLRTDRRRRGGLRGVSDLQTDGERDEDRYTDDRWNGTEDLPGGSRKIELLKRAMKGWIMHVRRVIVVLSLSLLLSQQIHSQTPTPAPSPGSAAAQTTGTPQNDAANIKCTDKGTYVNSKGQTVPRPENCSAAPKGATAECRDGSYSFSTSRRGTCSHHGGVAKWL